MATFDLTQLSDGTSDSMSESHSDDDVSAFSTLECVTLSQNKQNSVMSDSLSCRFEDDGISSTPVPPTRRFELFVCFFRVCVCVCVCVCPMQQPHMQ